MLPGKKYAPEDILKILRKRFWIVLVPWAVIAAGTAAVARKLPDVYRSTATIQVVPPQVPDSIVRNMNSIRLEERLNAIAQTILSRTRLERLITEFNLYEKERKEKILDEVVQRMRNDISVVPSKGDAFTVSYSGRSPQMVMRVTERLAGYFKEESVNQGTRRAQDTNTFLESQVEEAKRKLEETEDKLSLYKLRHAGELPTQQAANSQAIMTISQSLNGLARDIAADQQSKVNLERNIAQAEAFGEITGPALPAGSDPSAGTAAQKLAAAQADLERLRMRGATDLNPDVVYLQRIISKLQKDAEAEALKTPVGSGPATSPAEKARQANLALWREDLDRVIKNIAANQAEEKRLRKEIDRYQAKNDAIPTREQELTELTRDYTTLSGIYNTLVSQREASKASVNMEVRQIGEQFNLVDPARLPERPSSPDRTRTNFIGIFGGLAVGLLLVALIEYRDSTFKTDHELASVMALPVLAVVPLMRSDPERRAEFRKLLFINVGLGSTVMVCLAVLTYTFVR